MPKCQNAKMPNIQYPYPISVSISISTSHPIPKRILLHQLLYTTVCTLPYLTLPYLTLSYLSAYFNLWFIIMYGRSRYHETIGWWEREKGVADALDVLDSLWTLWNSALKQPAASSQQGLRPPSSRPSSPFPPTPTASHSSFIRFIHQIH